MPRLRRSILAIPVPLANTKGGSHADNKALIQKVTVFGTTWKSCLDTKQADLCDQLYSLRIALPYSVRRAFIGSTEAARRAGNSAASATTIATAATPDTMIRGSAALTLYN